MRKVNRTANFYLAVLVSVIFAIALIFAISHENSVKNLESGTPEKVVQEYLDFLNDGRNEEAAKLFSTLSKCTVDDIDRAYIDTSSQVLLEKVSLNGENSAIVYISIQRSDGPLMSDPYLQNENIRLVKEDGSWRLSGIPWPLYQCGDNYK
jgi:hypothetical protein